MQSLGAMYSAQTGRAYRLAVRILLIAGIVLILVVLVLIVLVLIVLILVILAAAVLILIVLVVLILVVLIVLHDTALLFDFWGHSISMRRIKGFYSYRPIDISHEFAHSVHLTSQKIAKLQ